MQAICKLAMKWYGFILPFKHLNHEALGKGMKRTSEQVFLRWVLVLALPLRSRGTLGKSLHLSEPLPPGKMGPLSK